MLNSFHIHLPDEGDILLLIYRSYLISKFIHQFYFSYPAMSLSKKDKSEMGAANEDLPKTEAEGKEEQKKTNVFVVILKILAILTLLYFFICSLDLLSASFQLLAGPGASKIPYQGPKKNQFSCLFLLAYFLISFAS